MNAKEASKLTFAGLEDIQKKRNSDSVGNLWKLRQYLIPYAASEGFGSLTIDEHALLLPEKMVLESEGYKLKKRYYMLGQYYIIVSWEPKSPKQQYDVDYHHNESQKLVKLAS